MDANLPDNAWVAPLPLPPLAPVGSLGALPLYPPSNWYPFYPPLPSKPRIWAVFVVYLLGFVAMLVAQTGVLTVVLVIEHIHEFESADQIMGLAREALSDPDILLLLLLSMQSALLATVLIAAWLSPEPLARRLRLGPSTLSSYGYPLVVPGAVSIGLLFMFLAGWLHLKEPEQLKFLNEAMRHLTPWQVVAAVLVVGGAPAFAEEWLFRGYMQTRLSRRLGRWPAIAITAVLFGVMHLNVFQGTFAMVLGFYVGYLAEKSGSVRPGMLCHFANNAVQVVLARYAQQWRVPPSIEDLLVGLGAVLILASILYMVRNVRPPAAVPEPEMPPTDFAPAAF